MDRCAAVQADSGALHWPTNCLLVSQPLFSYLSLDEEITACGRISGCGNLATVRGYLPTLVTAICLTPNAART